MAQSCFNSKPRGVEIPEQASAAIVTAYYKLALTLTVHLCMYNSFKYFLARKEAPLCRAIARSAELRVFLEERGELRSSQAWLALNSPTPTWLQGVQRLLKQIVGKQAITPAPSEAARATAASHDVVRSVREALHSYRSNQYAPVHCEVFVCRISGLLGN